jgi:hypothetical protein
MSNQNQSVLPEIDYLAKDYASFRQLILDHLTSRLSTWKEPSEADIGNVIVEVLAYVADYLSYYQDAVATEAYLSTARRRSSIKHHVRLLDYILHEGCNARTWVYMAVSRDMVLPRSTPLLARIGALTNIAVISPGSPAYNDAVEQQPTIFETMYECQLFEAHNAIQFFVEQDQDAVLPVGCTSATLLDPGRMWAGNSYEIEETGRSFKVGQVLLFEEMKGVETGQEIDADPTHRAVIRLRSVQPGRYGSTPVVTVTWDAEDALPFALTLAAHLDGDYITDMAVARGNMLLADHGRTIYYEQLPAVSQTRYRPHLLYPELTHCVASMEGQFVTRLSATQALKQNVFKTLPALSLFKKDEIDTIAVDPAVLSNMSKETVLALRKDLYAITGIGLSDKVEIIALYDSGWEIRDPAHKQSLLLTPVDANHLRVSILKQWHLRRDLISSVPLVNAYCVDMEDDGRAYLRFCTKNLGEPPVAGSTFLATYRVGRGSKGNISADTLAHVAINDNSILAVRNPLPAQGGINPQGIEHARLLAPFAFQSQRRCITEADYAEVVRRHPQVVNAVAQMRWTGSWSSVFLYVQRTPGHPVDAAFKAELVRYLDSFRATGYEVEIRPPFYVALNIILRVRLKADAYTNSVYDALRQTFNNTPDGFFYPGNFTFAQQVYPSQLIAKAVSVQGVAEVTVERFERMDVTSDPNMAVSQITIGPYEIARLDNDPHRPYNGQIQFLLEKGL